MKDNGYEVTHNGKLVTIFSAPNYCDQVRLLIENVSGGSVLIAGYCRWATKGHSSASTPSVCLITPHSTQFPTRQYAPWLMPHRSAICLAVVVASECRATSKRRPAATLSASAAAGRLNAMSTQRKLSSSAHSHYEYGGRTAACCAQQKAPPLRRRAHACQQARQRHQGPAQYQH